MMREEDFRAFFEDALGEYCARMTSRPARLADSMRYSLLAGGKRIRPVLFFCALDALRQPYRTETGLAIALECIHTYSLIHDDLPAMDNDDFRRGKPTCHRVFGEADAILAGDALLNLAAELALGESKRSAGHFRAASHLLQAAGMKGMCAGQSADLLFGADGREEELTFLMDRKTGALLTASLRMAADIAGRCEDALTAYGRALGRLFQITDDILDAGRDGEKLTAVSVYGLEGARRRADEALTKATDAIENADLDGEVLRGLAEKIRLRTG